VAALLRGRDRRAAAPTFPAAGLYLTGVEYDPAFGLPAPADEIAPACGELA
jgi:tRNA pseudouridine38-40 synthase